MAKNNYLHLGQDTVVKIKDIIGIFDMDTSTVSKPTRDFLNISEKQGRVVNVSYELPKAFVVTKNEEALTVYVSQLSSVTLEKRSKSKKFIY